MHSGDLPAARRSSVAGKRAINASWFSPGEIEGAARLRGSPAVAELRRSDRGRLKALRTDDRPVTTNYTVAEQDVAGPFLPSFRQKWRI